jgi:hypothetical protein
MSKYNQDDIDAVAAAAVARGIGIGEVRASLAASGWKDVSDQLEREQPGKRSGPTVVNLERALDALSRMAAEAKPVSFSKNDVSAEPIPRKAPTMRAMVTPIDQIRAPGAFEVDGELRRGSPTVDSDIVVMLPTAIARNSLVAQAGAHILFHKDADTAHAVGNGVQDIVLQRKPARFVNIEAAPFEPVDQAIEAEAPNKALPVFVEAIDWTQATTWGVHFEATRAQLRGTNGDAFFAELACALILGLSRVVDKTLLTALTAGALPAFTLAGASVQGIRFGELSGIVGTSAAGASVGADGALRAAGIEAEMTPVIAGSVIGAFNRCGVMIGEELTVIFDKRGTNGRQKVTAFIEVLPIIPDLSKFWTVAA